MKRFSPQQKPNYKRDRKRKKAAERDVWDALKRYVHKRDGGFCYSGPLCVSRRLGVYSPLTPSHIIPNGRNGSRIDTKENVILQCAMCNDAAANGVKLFGERWTGDEFMLKVLERREREVGFGHWEGLAYLRKMVEKQGIERLDTLREK